MLKKFMIVIGILILGVSIATGLKVYATSFDTTEIAEENESTQNQATNNGARFNCSSFGNWFIGDWLWYCGCGGCIKCGWSD